MYDESLFPFCENNLTQFDENRRREREVIIRFDERLSELIGENTRR